MGQKVITDKKENDPEWINELVSFLITTKDKNTINEYKKLLRDSYFDYMKEGLPPKKAIEKAKNVIMRFKINKITK